MIFCLIAQNRIHFKTQKKTSFPGFLFSATRNPGFKILTRIGKTTSVCTKDRETSENSRTYGPALALVVIGFVNQSNTNNNQRRSERGKGWQNASGTESLGSPKSPNNVASIFFSAVNLLAKDLMFEHGGDMLVYCLGAI